jgi:5-methylcytosine-specific restriction enzyme subunit McrC
MLSSLNGFRHIQTATANLSAARMPLLEVFIGEFLFAVQTVVKRGLHSDYVIRQDNLFALRGKLLMAQQLRQNLYRLDRFFAEHDEFSTNRPENRLLHAALRRVLQISASQQNQKLARELGFVFNDIPESTNFVQDFQRVRLDRGMGCYADALAWARLILEDDSPLTGVGKHGAPSLLFPMEAVFESYVARNLEKQLLAPFTLKTQARSHHLVRHREQNWFQMRPDAVVRKSGRDAIVLDTKWKILDGSKSNGTDKYGLAQDDFYQLLSYGQSYLDGKGEVVLIYPRTDVFQRALPVFEFPKTSGLRLWVLPFCLKTRNLEIPANAPFARNFRAQAA